MQRVEFEPQTLWARYLLAFLLVAIFFLTSHLVGLSALAGKEESSAAINISGRQRMLSQRILVLAERELQNPADRAVSDALDQSIALFSRSHEALMNGGAQGLTIAGANRRRWIYEDEEGGQSLEQRVDRFLNQLLVLRGERPGDFNAARADIFNLQYTDELLGALDNAVRLMQSQATGEVATLRRLSTFGLVAAFIVLFCEALFIFWPSHRAMARSFDALVAALDEAEDAQGEVKRMLGARTSFFASMSQDLQTPIKILHGYVDQLMNAGLPEGPARQLSLVKRAAEQMERIIDDVLDVRLLEEGLLKISEEPVELAPFVEDAVSHYRSQAERKGVIVSTKLNGSLPDWVETDAQRLRQVLDNLLSNAVKFTYDGSITVRITPLETDQWTLEVVDTGEGISPEVLDGLFQRFEMKAGEPGRAEGGTGLGLPICHDLARLMGGEMTVESVFGHGTTFRVTLPLKEALAPKAEAETPGKESAAA